MRRKTSPILILSLLVLMLATLAMPARGEEIDEVSKSFDLIGDSQPAAAHLPRPASKIAENVTVITAADIARINARTLADVLHTVPGIHFDQMQSPGSSAYVKVLTMSDHHVLVQVDGIPQNMLSADNAAEVGFIPVQMIERVEIIKGAASARWGSAMGG